MPFSGRTCGNRIHVQYDVLDVINRIGDTCILCDALIMEVDLAGVIQRDVLKQRVALDRIVDVGLTIFIQIDDLGIAAALEVEDAVVVPAVLVVADE